MYKLEYPNSRVWSRNYDSGHELKCVPSFERVSCVLVRIDSSSRRRIITENSPRPVAIFRHHAGVDEAIGVPNTRVSPHPVRVLPVYRLDGYRVVPLIETGTKTNEGNKKKIWSTVYLFLLLYRLEFRKEFPVKLNSYIRTPERSREKRLWHDILCCV